MVPKIDNKGILSNFMRHYPDTKIRHHKKGLQTNIYYYGCTGQQNTS